MSDKISFWISLDGYNNEEISDNKISKILSCKVESGIINAPENLKDTDPYKPEYDKELIWLINLIRPHLKELAKAGVSIKESSIWLSYTYFLQCNMQLNSNTLKEIGDMELDLCISCYSDDNLSKREDFNTQLFHSKEGVYLCNTSQLDVKIGELFPIEIEVKNERKNNSFILTRIDIEYDFVNDFEIVDFNIPSTSKDIDSTTASIFFDCIIKANDSKTILIYIKAKKEGIFRGGIEVYEGGQFIKSELTFIVE